jgi:UDP-2-acetamido-3-amino-2,3-dideoxy-glucuronate N-acetyltransferase
LRDYALVVGVPAKQIGWISEYGEKLQLPIESNDKTLTAKCIKTGRLYSLKGKNVTKVGVT